jgi:hypothetical protein
MASLQQHVRDCTEFLGDGYVEVNRWIDELFATLGPAHRKVRHHKEGIEEAKSIFGEKGARAAVVHILRDCRHIPVRADYESGAVDALGLKKDWPTSAYVSYSEEDFKTVVNNQLFGPKGYFLWSYINEAGLVPFLINSTRLSEAEIEALKPKWTEAVTERSKLGPMPKVAEIRTEIPPQATSYLEHYLNSPAAAALGKNFGQITFAYVPTNALVTPLVFIDGEYLDGLKPELQSTGDADVVKFCLPSVGGVQVRTVTDIAMRSVIFLSSLKTLTVSPISVRQIPEGTEVRFVIGANISMVLVSMVGDRLIIRNGIHRAYLLALLGLKEIPCILVKEGAVPSLFTTAYPSFIPQVLMLSRPPLLTDFANPQLTLEAPLQRTNKMIRISAEETILPVE